MPYTNIRSDVRCWSLWPQSSSSWSW